MQEVSLETAGMTAEMMGAMKIFSDGRSMEFRRNVSASWHYERYFLSARPPPLLMSAWYSLLLPKHDGNRCP